MSQVDLNRVRGDLATMKHAAGLELTFGWTDVRLSLLLFGAGVFLSLWTILAPWEGLIRVGLIPGILVAAAWFGLDLRRSIRRKGRSAIHHREFKLGLIVSVLLIVVMEGYFAWGKSLGIPPQLVGAIGVFFIGVALMPWALSNRDRLCVLGVAIPLMLYGVIIPLCAPQEVIVGAGVAIAVVGLAVAAIQSWQLRKVKSDHATN